MKIFSRLLFLALLGGLIFSSCKKEASEGKKAKLDSLKVTIDSLQQAADIAWDSMIIEDDKKLDYLKRMVDEAVYVLNVSEVDQNKIHQDVDALRQFRYDRTSMSDSDLIDAYDNATDSTMRVIMAFIDSIEGGQVPLIASLIDEVNHMDEMVIHRRSHYDEPAIAFNKTLKKNKRGLKKLGEPYSSLEPLPLFVLNPDI